MKVYLFLHVLGAVLFIGNIITGVFWKVATDRTGEPQSIYRMSKFVMLADYVFTLPGIALLITFGHLLVEEAGYPLMEWNWLSLSYLLFIVSGVVWMVALVPLQRKMVRMSKIGVESGRIPESYYHYSRLWSGIGTFSILLPLITLFLMVVKP